MFSLSVNKVKQFPKVLLFLIFSLPIKKYEYFDETRVLMKDYLYASSNT